MLTDNHDLVSWSSQLHSLVWLVPLSAIVVLLTFPPPQLFFPSSPLLVLPFSPLSISLTTTISNYTTSHF